MSARFVRNPALLIRRTRDCMLVTLAAAPSQSRAEVFELNATAATLFDELGTPMTIASLVAGVVAPGIDADPVNVERDVTEMLRQWQRTGIVTECS